MADNGRPAPWRAFRLGHSRWLNPLLFAEWLTEWAVYGLRRWALIDLIQLVAALGVVWAAAEYLLSGDDRREALNAQRKSKHYQAWQVINTAQGKGGNGGRIDALQDLVTDGVDLTGVDLSGAYLNQIHLPHARLGSANLSNVQLEAACLRDAFMQKANLKGASLYDADLIGVSFVDADLRGADLGWAKVRRKTQSSAKDQATQQSKTAKEPFDMPIIGANLYGIRPPTDDFLEWALSRGAVCYSKDEEWTQYQHSATTMSGRENRRRVMPHECVDEKRKFPPLSLSADEVCFAVGNFDPSREPAPAREIGMR